MNDHIISFITLETTSECGDKTGSNGIKTENASKSGSKNDANAVKQNQKKSGTNKKSNKKQNQRKNVHQRHKSGSQLATTSVRCNETTNEKNLLTFTNYILKLNDPLSKDQQIEQELTGKIFSTMEKHKEVFFVIRLHTVQAAANLPPVIDPDVTINCDLMDGRDAFLTLAREKHYEFSSLRRAKWSSMALLYELHNSEFPVSLSFSLKFCLAESRERRKLFFILLLLSFYLMNPFEVLAVFFVLSNREKYEIRNRLVPQTL